MAEVDTGAEVTEALIETEPAEITSRMDRGGVVFGDGIEGDLLELQWGAHATVAVSAQRLHLVV